MPAEPRSAAAPGRNAALVAAGIFLSRIFGLIRQRVLAHYLGLSAGGDAFTAAFRIPNLLQNLLGEGVLSASFIPVYARLRAEGEDQAAERVAGGVFALLALVTATAVLAGVLLAGPLTALVAPGFTGAKRELTIRLVRILFPGAGLLVLSAWCLGVLNSHRKFLLSYAAPVVWNLAIIVALIVRGTTGDDAGPAIAAAVGSVIGSALQFVVQLPSVLGLLPRFRPALAGVSGGIRTVIKNFVPVFISRGVVQISAFVDTIIASLLGQGPVAALGMAQVIYTLPVSLFGMSVSAAELPEMSSATGGEEEVAGVLRRRLDSGLRRIAFYVVPSAAAFLAFGGVIAGALFQTGRFTAEDSTFVWALLAGSAIGLLAATMGRLYSSAYYALRDTRTPLRYAVIRVALTTVLGFLAALGLPRLLGLDPKWGAACLTASSGIVGWLEFALLRGGLNRRLGPTGLTLRYHTQLWAAAIFGVVAGFGVYAWTPTLGPLTRAAVVLAPFGSAYLLLAYAMGIPEARALGARFVRG